MRAADGITFSNVDATPAPFHLEGGRYAVAVKATGYGTVKLQMLGPDGATYLDCKAAFNNAGTEADLVIGAFAADGMKVLDLPPGTYQFTIDTATAVYAGAYRVPGE